MPLPGMAAHYNSGSQPGIATPVAVVCLISRIAKASDKNIHNYTFLLFVYGTIFFV